MARGVCAAILLALAAEGRGQFLPSWSGEASYSSSGRFSSWTSSVARSSTWPRDQHGRMHQQVQESRSDDGIQHVEETAYALQAAPTGSMGWPQRMPTGLQAMLAELVDSPRLVEPRPQAPPPLPFRTGIVVTPSQPVLVVQLPFALRGSRPLARADVEMQPVALGAPRGQHGPDMMSHMAVMMAGVFCALAVSMLASALLFSGCCCLGKAEAREPQLRSSLAEPLAPAEEAAALRAVAPHQVLARAPTPVQQYLLGVYARAQESAC